VSSPSASGEPLSIAHTPLEYSRIEGENPPGRAGGQSYITWASVAYLHATNAPTVSCHHASANQITAALIVVVIVAAIAVGIAVPAIVCATETKATAAKATAMEAATAAAAEAAASATVDAASPVTAPAAAMSTTTAAAAARGHVSSGA
jgi:hypothetical protein